MFVVVLIVTGIVAGLLAYLFTSGQPASEKGSGAPGSSAPSSAQPQEPRPLASIFDADEGQCINQNPYPSKLNALELQEIPCEDPAARMRLLFITNLDTTSACSGGGQGYYIRDDRLYCYQSLIRVSYCYPAWIGNREGSPVASTVLNLPHSCDETVEVRDEDLPRPSDWENATDVRRADIRIVDLNPNGTELSCEDLFFELQEPNPMAFCAQVA